MNDMPDPETFACVVTRKPEATLDALAARLRHAEERVRLAAAVDLLASGKEAEAAIPALAGALADQNEAVRVTAAKALGMMGRPAIAVLTRALRHKSVVVRRAAERPEEAHGIDPRSAASLSSRRPPPEVA